MGPFGEEAWLAPRGSAETSGWGDWVAPGWQDTGTKSLDKSKGSGKGWESSQGRWDNVPTIAQDQAWIGLEHAAAPQGVTVLPPTGATIPPPSWGGGGVRTVPPPTVHAGQYLL